MIEYSIMKLSEIYKKTKGQGSSFSHQKTPVISFEIFPPKNDEDGDKLEKLLNHLKILKKYNPAFISLTYGAGGTTQNVSLNIIKRIQQELKTEVMPHFTCVGASINFVEKYLEDINSLNIKNILALRGDLPEGMDMKSFDFKYANELVTFIKNKTDLSIGVAGYPEGHIECNDLEKDLKNLKKKVDAGSDAIYTQMFFDNDKFFSFLQLARDKGINVPVIPGILPIKSFPQLEKMLSMAKVNVPKNLMDQLEKYKDNDEDIEKIGIEFASYQCRQLIDSGIEGLHFYTLNTSHSVSKILDNLGLSVIVN